MGEILDAAGIDDSRTNLHIEDVSRAMTVVWRASKIAVASVRGGLEDKIPLNSARITDCDTHRRRCIIAEMSEPPADRSQFGDY
jgi:hypothetical protein